MKTLTHVLRSALIISILAAVGTTMPTPASASDIDLGSPATIEELLASPEYLPEHSDVARLYQAFFNREPDIAGLVYWIDVYEDGTEMKDLAWLFSNSQEFRQTYGADLSNGDFLTVVYENVLGRSYDQAGFDYWLGEMQRGLSRPETVLWIVAGQEFKTNYPFTPTFPRVENALLRASDVPIDYTDTGSGRFTATESDILDLHQCVQYRVLSSNTYEVFYGRPDGSAFVHQKVYAYSNVASAQAAVDNHRKLPIECSSRFVNLDDGSVLNIQYWAIDQELDRGDDLGDESVAVRAQWTWGNGTIYEFFLYVVRNGNVVTVTDLTTRSLHTDYLQGLSYAGLTDERMQALLTP